MNRIFRTRCSGRCGNRRVVHRSHGDGAIGRRRGQRVAAVSIATVGGGIGEVRRAVEVRIWLEVNRGFAVDGVDRAGHWFGHRRIGIERTVGRRTNRERFHVLHAIDISSRKLDFDTLNRIFGTGRGSRDSFWRIVNGNHVDRQGDRLGLRISRAVLRGGGDGEVHQAVGVFRRGEDQGGLVPVADVDALIASRRGEGVARRAIGDGRVERYATDFQLERLGAILVGGVCVDGRQLDRMVFQAGVQHLGDVDVVQHAAQRVVCIPGRGFELEFGIAVSGDRHDEGVSLHADGGGIQGADFDAAPEYVDHRIVLSARTRRVVDRDGVRRAGLCLDDGVQAGVVAGVFLKLDDLAVAWGLYAVVAALADFDLAAGIPREPRSARGATDRRVVGVIYPDDAPRTIEVGAVEVDRGHRAAAEQTQVRSVGNRRDRDVGRRYGARFTSVVDRSERHLGFAAPVAGRGEVNRGLAVGTRWHRVADFEFGLQRGIAVQLAVFRQGGDDKAGDGTVHILAVQHDLGGMVFIGGGVVGRCSRGVVEQVDSDLASGAAGFRRFAIQVAATVVSHIDGDGTIGTDRVIARALEGDGFNQFDEVGGAAAGLRVAGEGVDDFPVGGAAALGDGDPGNGQGLEHIGIAEQITCSQVVDGDHDFAEGGVVDVFDGQVFDQRDCVFLLSECGAVELDLRRIVHRNHIHHGGDRRRIQLAVVDGDGQGAIGRVRVLAFAGEVYRTQDFLVLSRGGLTGQGQDARGLVVADCNFGVADICDQYIVCQVVDECDFGALQGAVVDVADGQVRRHVAARLAFNIGVAERVGRGVAQYRSVVHRSHGDGAVGRSRGQRAAAASNAAVGGGVGEVRGAVEVFVWLEVNGGFTVDRVDRAGYRLGHGRVGVERAVGWGADGEGFHVCHAVYVGRAQFDFDALNRIFGTRCCGRFGDRCIVDRGHSDGAVGRRRGQRAAAVSDTAVGGGVGEVGGAVEVFVWFEVNGGFAVDCVNRASYWLGHGGVGVERAVGWGADGERFHVCHAIYVGRAQFDFDALNRIFRTRCGGRCGDRCIVDRGHGDSAVGWSRGQRAAAVSDTAVGGGVGEVRGAVEVFIWLEVNRGFAIDRINSAGHRFGHGGVGVERAIGRRADGERFHVCHAIHVGRAQFDRDTYAWIFSTRCGSGRSHWRVVDRSHGDGAVGRRRSQRAAAVSDTAVGRGVSEVRRAVEVRVWFEVNRGFAIDRINSASHRFGHRRVSVERAIGRRADGERFHVCHAIYVGRAQFDFDALNRIFGTRCGGRCCDRRIVDRSHGDGAVGRSRSQRVGAVSIAAVGRGVGEVCGAVEVFVRFEVNRGFAVDRVDRAGYRLGHGSIGVERAIGWRADGERFHVLHAIDISGRKLDFDALGRIFRTGRGSGDSFWRIVDRSHGDSAVGRSRSQRVAAVSITAVGRGIGEVRRAVEVFVRFEVNRGFAVDRVDRAGYRLGHGSVGIERAVGRRADGERFHVLHAIDISGRKLDFDALGRIFRTGRSGRHSHRRVVHRSDSDGAVGWSRGQRIAAISVAAVGRGISEIRGAVEVFVWLEVNSRFAVDRVDRASHRFGHGSIGVERAIGWRADSERFHVVHAVYVGGRKLDFDALDRIFRARRSGRHSLRRIVDRRHSDSAVSRRRGQRVAAIRVATVGRGIGEVRRAVEVFVRLEVHGGFAIDRVNRASHRLGHGSVGVERAVGRLADGERFHVRQAIHIGRAQLDRNAYAWIFSPGCSGRDRFRCIVHRRHSDSAVSRSRGQRVAAVSVAAVGGGIGEIRGAVEVFVRLEVNRGFAVDRVDRAGHRFGHGRVGVERAIGWRADSERFHVRQAIPIGRTQFDRNALGRIFSSVRCDHHCHRRIVNRRHRHVQRAARTGIGGVADLRHFTVVILDRGKRIRTIRTNGDGTDTFDNGGLACVIRGAANGECRDGQHVVDVAVIAQHVASGNLLLGNRVGVCDQHARVVDSDHGGSGGFWVDRQVFVVTATCTGDGGADGQVFAVGQVCRRIDADGARGFTGFDGDGGVVGQRDGDVGLRGVVHGRGIDDLAALIDRRVRAQRDGGGVDGVIDLRNRRRRVGGDDQVAAAGRAGDGGGDRRGIQVRRVIARERDVQRARGLAGEDHDRQAVGQGDGQVTGRRLGDKHGVNHDAAGFGDARRGGQGDGDAARIEAVIGSGSEQAGRGIGGIQAVRRITDSRVNRACGGLQHDKAVATAHGAVRASGSRAGSSGFKVLGRVGTGSDGLLQFGNGGCFLGSGGTQVGH